MSGAAVRDLSAFKTYDVRGCLDRNLDAELVRDAGRAFVDVMGAGCVVVGHDCRPSSGALHRALIDGLTAQGAEVLDLGQAGTEEVYFATARYGADGGIEVTASHNPIEYNGLKLVGRESRPLDPESELGALRAAVGRGCFAAARSRGAVRALDHRPEYAHHLLGLLDLPVLRPLKVLVNAGNGVAGPAFDALAEGLAARSAPLRFVRCHHHPDPAFPNGIPNPLLPQNRKITSDAVLAAGADLGVAWDGDFDRCFFFDADGRFVEGEYVVALLAQAFLLDDPGATIVHDPRVVLNTQEVVRTAGGRPVVSRTGHAFVKAKMREVDAVYGGEMSAHHYFRDFFYCDSGMLPWLKLVELMSRSGRTLADLVAAMRVRFPSSGECNFELSDPAAAIERVLAVYAPEAEECDWHDGVSLRFGSWRFNLRASNTEPLLRLNVESRGDRSLMERELARIAALIMVEETTSRKARG